MFGGGCQRDLPVIDLAGSNYPQNVGTLILTKCAVAGCLNSESNGAAAGLDLSSWDAMMKGDRNGVVCIPYPHEYSTLFLFCNTINDLGATVTPSMSVNGDPLSRQEVIMLRDWINEGAPNAHSFVKFSDNPNRKDRGRKPKGGKYVQNPYVALVSAG